MPKGQKRVTGEHAWTGLAHHMAHPVALEGFVTVHRTFGAGGFAPTKGTVIQASVGVLQEGPAVGTHLPPLPMGSPTIKSNHGRDSSLVEANVEGQRTGGHSANSDRFRSQGPRLFDQNSGDGRPVPTGESRLFFPHRGAALGAGQGRKTKSWFGGNRRATFRAVSLSGSPFRSLEARVRNRPRRFKGFSHFDGILLVSSWHVRSPCKWSNPKIKRRGKILRRTWRSTVLAASLGPRREK